MYILRFKFFRINNESTELVVLVIRKSTGRLTTSRMEQKSKSLSPAENFSRRNIKLFINVANMLDNFKYPVVEVKRLQTSFGERVQVELYDNILTLPKSYYNEITDDEIKEFNTGHYYIKKQMKTNKSYDIEFEKAKFVKGFKKILQIRDMLDHISHPIYAMQRKHTIYGETIQVDILDEIIFLPKRFNGLTDQTINEINHGNYCLKKIPGNNNVLERLEIQVNMYFVFVILFKKKHFKL